MSGSYIQSSQPSLRAERKFAVKRASTRAVVMTEMVTPTPVTVGASVGGSIKFDDISGLTCSGIFERSVPGGIEAAMTAE
jgi:hypothetical protein